jgi:nucleoside 2-deoxyribosyltransferase
MSSKPRVYLAGPITGLLYQETVDWREKVKDQLAPDVVAMSPMRGKAYLATGKPIEDATTQALGNVMSSAHGITGRDRNDVRNADAVLMNLLGAERVSIGTMIEAGWADAFRVPLVVVREPDNIHRHGMLDEVATYTVGDLDEAVHLVRMVVLP